MFHGSSLSYVRRRGRRATYHQTCVPLAVHDAGLLRHSAVSAIKLRSHFAFFDLPPMYGNVAELRANWIADAPR
jgi:hypothetical protein